MNRYRVLLPLLVHTDDGSYGQFDEFETDFSEEDERTNVESGLLAIVPQTYKVVGDSVVHDTQPGDTFEMALTIGVEALLVAGGHIERVEQAPPPPPKPRKAATKKE